MKYSKIFCLILFPAFWVQKSLAEPGFHPKFQKKFQAGYYQLVSGSKSCKKGFFLEADFDKGELFYYDGRALPLKISPFTKNPSKADRSDSGKCDRTTPAMYSTKNSAIRKNPRSFCKKGKHYWESISTLTLKKGGVKTKLVTDRYTLTCHYEFIPPLPGEFEP